MGRIYTAQFNGVGATVTQDIFEIVADTASIVKIHEIGVSQLSDVGDAEEEMLLLLLKSGQTTSGAGGSVVTPVPQLFGDSAFSGSAESNNTTKASLGTIVTHYAWDWNIRMAFVQIFTPETMPVLSPGRRMTVELETAPADAVTLSGYIVFEEIG